MAWRRTNRKHDIPQSLEEPTPGPPEDVDDARPQRSPEDERDGVDGFIPGV